MTDHLNLIRIKLQHLSRMSEYLAYSLSQVESVLKLKDWAALSPDQHESLAAFRVRFSEFEEQCRACVAFSNRSRFRRGPAPC